jgi:hypothetical protein
MINRKKDYVKNEIWLAEKPLMAGVHLQKGRKIR